jgi:F-type H+-transporting ATPase subunit b
LENLGINLGFLLVQIVNFAVIFVVLKTWVYNPLTRMLEKRRQTVAQGLEDARVASEARSNAEREANRIITEAQVKANDILREADVRAEAIKRDIVGQAETEVEKKHDQAMTELGQERNRMMTELRGDVITLAIAATNKLISASLTEERQRALLHEFFSGVRNGQVVVLEGEELAGQAAEVTSAVPLTSEEQAVVKKEILGKLGGRATISFRVDRSILGGLVVRAGDRVVDGSVLGQLQSLKQSLV